ncbi:probable BOI-related E3 ubiquitin-protein ligase 3 [Physcomitrium patens]|uniref:RING-type domain-containing protein n=1 Tax=Physcomitrium patens TaxID=3218 RepID=A0A2K1IZ30_PHYPA|nr:probable BOI-related E3 ubiquitin-protein ligase 2 [Physcomitrium patens]PNR34521.1 hypothetical protein PHYPA_024338 [Physcomitrium patens]|eukprot:XP_024403437.1 probable BOI-related E3 ubiquitin-protein ligase 2 [Physcomitrella patens]
MAVQSQYLPNVVLPDDGSNRAPAVVGNEEHPNFLTAGGINQNAFNLGKFRNPSTVMPESNQYHVFNQLAGGRQGFTSQLDASLPNGADKEIVANNLLGSRKRSREAEDLRSQWQQQQQLLMNTVSEFHQNTGPGSVVNPQSTGVSTGLRLTFEDDRLRSSSPVSTSGRLEATKIFTSSIAENFGTHLQQERDEIEQLLKTQRDQLKAFLEQMRQRHSRQLVAVVEEGFSRRLREKDVEMEKVKLQNQELMERFTQLNAESYHWQNKLRTTEAMVNILRSNLHQAQQQQQAYPPSREQSKEGCGDSEADDCASSYVDDRNDAHTRTINENKELREQRTCRVCRCKDVSMLLLPCRHLCLCLGCEGQLHACPLCRTPKNASVQVYMS